MSNLNTIIGTNLKKVRKSRNLSLDELAELSGVSKSMLAQIERGESNPTITTIWKISNALKVPFTTFTKHQKNKINFIPSSDMQLSIEEKGYNLFSLFEYEQDKKFEVFFKTIEPGAVLDSEPHGDGAEEYIFMFEGEMKLSINGEEFIMKKGDVINFVADTNHSYYNNSEEKAKMFVIVYYHEI